MSYDPALYDIDYVNQYYEDASLKDGAVLYRVASPSHWHKKHILTGAGAERSTTEGRFHRVRQRTSYCGNNSILCIAEVLYHMYRRVLDGVKNHLPVRQLDLWSTTHYRLAVFSVKPIDELIYVDSEGARTTYSSWVAGSTVVFPDPIYGPLHDFSDNLRGTPKRGVVYPSARHSDGFAFAFFNDETRSIKNTFYEALPLTLRLIPETQNLASMPPNNCQPYKEKLHATLGYYEFTNPVALADVIARSLIYPANIKERGYIDFVRRVYRTYPLDAILP